MARPAKQALSILKEKNINRLAVVNEKGELEGLLTPEMIAKRLPEDTIAET
ncbi:CBS domain-containing protein [Nitrososphaera sp.]|uniref:CBS domain-containing protein n=1 Tax=Nitrososphaera sp. TaxID=1971748 RepID=UPI002ED91B68